MEGPYKKGGKLPPEVKIGNHLMIFDSSKKLTNLVEGEKFLLMRRINSIDNMNSVSSFLLKKCIDGIVGAVAQVNKLRDGSILIQTKTIKQASRLRQLIQLNHEIQVDVQEHEKLNSSKGVIRCHDFKGISNEEIIKEFKEQDTNKVEILDIYRVMRRSGENSFETGTYFVTFATAKIPEFIFAGYTRLEVKPYIPSPMKCHNCFKYDHSKARCPAPEKICHNCSETSHTTLENPICLNPAKCTNCGENHSNLSKECPLYLKKQEIQKIKCIENVPFHKAVSLYNARNPVFARPSYASMTKSNKSCGCACKCGQQTIQPPEPPKSSVQDRLNQTAIPSTSASTTPIQPTKRNTSASNRSSSAGSSKGTKPKIPKKIVGKSGNKIDIRKLKLQSKTEDTDEDSEELNSDDMEL